VNAIVVWECNVNSYNGSPAFEPGACSLNIRNKCKSAVTSWSKNDDLVYVFPLNTGFLKFLTEIKPFFVHSDSVSLQLFRFAENLILFSRKAQG
jgi:hypothetical protein